MNFPSKAMVLQLIGVILQYGLVFLLFYFLVKVLRVMNKDINSIFQQKRAGGAHFSSKQMHDIRKRAVLKVIHGQDLLPQEEYLLEDSLTIGRSSHNDICIDDNFVSYEHVCIAKNSDGYVLTDLRSTNGTYINGRRIKGDVLLSNGDEIKIGAVTLTFQFVR